VNTEQLLFIIAALLLLITLIVIGVLAFFGHRYLKLNNKLKEFEKKSDTGATQGVILDAASENLDSTEAMNNKISPQLLQALRSNSVTPSMRKEIMEKLENYDTSKLANLSPSKSVTESLASVCVDHPDVPALKKCAISDQSYCELCITRQLDVWVAKKYLDVLLDSEWEEIYMLPDTKGHHDVKSRLQKVKSELWQNNGIPVLIQGHYKINVEDDKIESYTVIKARVEDLRLLKRELSFLG
jgi:uncharacterized protein YfeS